MGMLTIANALNPSYDEFTLATLLGKSTVQEVALIQKQLDTLLGDSVWLTPPNCLHVTLMEIICDADYGNTPRKELFDAWYADYGALAKQIIEGNSTFPIVFNEIHVSPMAIIIKTNQPDSLNEIRKQLLNRIKLPEGTKLPPDIGHSTIARFKKEIDLDKVRHIVKPIPVNIIQKVQSLQLIEGLGPPTLNPNVLENYPLITN